MTDERKYLKGENNRREGEVVNLRKRSTANHQRCDPATVEYRPKNPRKGEQTDESQDKTEKPKG
ncbi:MAG: hypothetical protein II407_08345 [Prevotella sp.]|nr:hypothetical protein [Prevotella sp.]